MFDAAIEWKEVVDLSPVRTAVCDGNGEILYANQVWQDLSPQDHLQKVYLPDCIHSDDQLRFREFFQSLQSSPRTDAVTVRLLESDGVTAYRRVQLHPSLHANGSSKYWIVTADAVLCDLSSAGDRPAVRCNLAKGTANEKEKALIRIIETIPAFVWCANEDGELTYVNQRILAYAGCELEEMQRSGWLSYLHPDDLAATQESWTRAVETSALHDIQYRLRARDGSYRWFHVLGQPAFSSDGKFLQWYGLLLDIDDRRKVEQQLREAELMLAKASRIATVGELAAAIAHEVNQPLAAVVSNGQACLRWLSGDQPNLSKAREAAERIVRDGKAAGSVIARIRALFKRCPMERAELSLNPVIEEVLLMLSESARQRNVSIETDFASDLPCISADRVQLQQLIWNLVTNAMEAMETVHDRPRVVRLCTFKENSETIRAEIIDSGEGGADFDKIFQAFYSTKANGMGMGLSICRSVVESHGGRLWAESADGQGTRFCFTLSSLSVAACESSVAF